MRSADIDARPGQRRVWGTFQSDATMLSPGSCDWSVVRLATGSYQVRFNPPFRSKPVVTSASATFGVTGPTAIAPDVTTITSWIPNTGAGLDASVNFQAVGR